MTLPTPGPVFEPPPEFICVYKLIVKSSVVECSQANCPLWDAVGRRCTSVLPALWTKIDHQQRRSNLPALEVMEP